MSSFIVWKLIPQSLKVRNYPKLKKGYFNQNLNQSNNDSSNFLININSSLKQFNKNLQSIENPFNNSNFSNNLNKIKLNNSTGAVKQYKNRRNIDYYN